MLTDSVTPQSAPPRQEPPTLPRIGALSDPQRWALIVEAIAQHLADGDRASRGLPVVHFARLSEEEQAVYRRHAFVAVLPVRHPDYVQQAREAALLRACELWEGASGREPSRGVVVRMQQAWAWAWAVYDAALDGTLHERQIRMRANLLKLIAAPRVPGRTVQ